LPLLRFTSTYQAVVSTVAADAGVVATVSNPPANATAAAAANPDRHRPRHLVVRANPTDIASFLSSWGPSTCSGGHVGADADDTRAQTNGPHRVSANNCRGGDPGGNLWIYGR
jgi:hypothetical protein